MLNKKVNISSKKTAFLVFIIVYSSYFTISINKVEFSLIRTLLASETVSKKCSDLGTGCSSNSENCDATRWYGSPTCEIHCSSGIKDCKIN